MGARFKWIFILLAGAILAGVWGCGNVEDIFKKAEQVSILAGSELKDLEPMLPQIRKATGLDLHFHYIGTLDGAEKLVMGEQVDFAWFSHGKYLTLLQQGRGVVKAEEKMMLSPVVLGVKESKARQWGWVNNPDLTWTDVVDKVRSGELRYAMTNPSSSNSGFTALMGVTAALSNTADAIESDDVSEQALKDFFKGQKLTAGSSGWLASSYVAQQDSLDGIINYESVLMGLNQGPELREKLFLVYPKEGIITADYPLMLINSERKEAYNKLVAYLKEPEVQKRIMNETRRRPVVPGVTLSKAFPDRLLVELPFPNKLEVVNEIILTYLDKQILPSHSYYVLDVSGSMKGQRLNDLKNALVNLTGADQSVTGQFSRFRRRERLTFIPFSSDVEPNIGEFEIDETGDIQTDMIKIRDYVNSLEVRGSTAMYSALQEAYQRAMEAKRKDPERHYSIVLMTDGANNRGMKLDRFKQYYSMLPAQDRAIKTFTILFGEANAQAMKDVAHLTGGRMFDSHKKSLSFAFKKIRGYQ